MERFTICGLRSFVDYVNETVPKIEGTTCPRDAYDKIVSYIVRHNI